MEGVVTICWMEYADFWTYVKTIFIQSGKNTLSSLYLTRIRKFDEDFIERYLRYWMPKKEKVMPPFYGKQWENEFKRVL